MPYGKRSLRHRRYFLITIDFALSVQPFHLKADTLPAIRALHRGGLNRPAAAGGIHKRIDCIQRYHAQSSAFFFIHKCALKSYNVANLIPRTVALQHNNPNGMIFQCPGHLSLRELLSVWHYNIGNQDTQSIPAWRGSAASTLFLPDCLAAYKALSATNTSSSALSAFSG